MEVIKTQISYEGGITTFEVRNAETNEVVGYDFVADEVDE